MGYAARGRTRLKEANIMPTNYLRLAVVLGLLSAIGPFAIDMYLPALPSMGSDLAASAGADARNMVGRTVLDALGPDGLLINVARGSVVDEPELLAALTEGRIGGAGLDVFADEPNVPEGFYGLDNVVLQPHQASATVETRMAMGQLVLDNLEAFFAGRPLPTAVV